MIVTLYGGINEIGGNKVLVESEDKTRIFLDFGRRLSFLGDFYQEFINPRPKNLLRDFLKLGVVPKIPNLYRNDLLKIDFSILNEDAKKNIPPQEEASDFWECSDLLKNLKDTPMVSGILLSHGHFDHVQDICFLNPEIPIYCSEKTYTLLEIITDLSPLRTEYEFLNYFDYNLSSTSFHYKSAYPYSIKIEKKGIDEDKKLILNNPKFELDLDMGESPKKRAYKLFNDKNKFSLGSFHIDAIPVDHSVPGALMFLVTDKKTNKTLLYSGDFKFGGESFLNIEDFIKKINSLTKKIDAFVCEGTRIYIDTIPKEKDIEKDILDNMKGVEKLIMIDFNWKDLGRLNIILNCCKKVGRTLLISPKTAYLLFQFHQKFPDDYVNPIDEEYLGIYLKRSRDLIYSPSDYGKFNLGLISYWGKNSTQTDRNITRIKHMLDLLELKAGKYLDKFNQEPSANYIKYLRKLEELQKEWFGDLEEKDLAQRLNIIWNLASFHFEKGIRAYEIRKNPEKYVLQFSFWDANELFDLSPPNGDMSGSYFIKANTEPFNDEMLIDEQKMMNWFDHFNVKYDIDPETENAEKKVFSRKHVSGHASGSEIKKLMSKLKPKIVIPIHTNHNEKFIQIGAETGIKIIIPEYGKPIIV